MCIERRGEQMSDACAEHKNPVTIKSVNEREQTHVSHPLNTAVARS